ncbi:nucleoside 2-deoxyribosyltransferase [Candidatus Woesearchaeota archaeon]|nr:nucleoside 2-deoxyribosyltransferase [Candidatus Woesearchaeota archaeon]
MKAYLAIKFHEDCKNKKLIETIIEVLEKSGFEVKTIIKDYEKWGKVKFKPEELMKLTFKLIDSSDLLIIEFSEKGVGLGIEAGYAYSKNIPIVVIAKKGSDISNTLLGIAKEVILYENPEELTLKLKK